MFLYYYHILKIVGKRRYSSKSSHERCINILATCVSSQFVLRRMVPRDIRQTIRTFKKLHFGISWSTR
jgi:hypothetical protein